MSNEIKGATRKRTRSPEALARQAAEYSRRWREDPEYRRITSARRSAWQKQNRERCNVLQRRWKESHAKEYRESCMLNGAKNRAAKYGMEFNLTIDDVKIPDLCPIFGVPFEFPKWGKAKHSPSLDRIDNSKGYIKRNVLVVSEFANRVKNSATPDELMLIARFYFNRVKGAQSDE